MKTAIVFKWHRDPQDARVAADGTVTWPGVKLSATDDDPAAMDVARALSAEQDIVGITIGDGKPEWAAARGASSTVVVEDVLGGPEGTQSARAMAAAVREADVDVAVIGDSEWDAGVVSALAGQMQWPAFAGVTAAEPVDGGVSLTLKRAGGSQVVFSPTPVLLAAVALGKEQDVPGMKQTLAARKKPLQKTTAAELGVQPESLAESMGTALPQGASATMIDGADAVAAAATLLEALRGDGIL